MTAQPICVLVSTAAIGAKAKAATHRHWRECVDYYVHTRFLLASVCVWDVFDSVYATLSAVLDVVAYQCCQLWGSK